MEKSFGLRPATLEDLPKVVEIENRVHQAPWNLDHFSQELTKPYSQFLLLTDDETDSEIAGYVVSWMMFDECQILNVAVDLPYRRMGFAKAMLRKLAILAQKKGINRLELEVRKSNMPAIQLYQNLQFSITHIRKGFYSDGEDAYHMGLSLLDDPLVF